MIITRIYADQTGNSHFEEQEVPVTPQRTFGVDVITSSCTVHDPSGKPSGIQLSLAYSTMQTVHRHAGRIGGNRSGRW